MMTVKFFLRYKTFNIFFATDLIFIAIFSIIQLSSYFNKYFPITNKLNFRSYNVRGIEAFNKTISSFHTSLQMVLYSYKKHVQEITIKEKWQNKFKDQSFSSHGKSNLGGVVIGFYVTKTLELIDKTYLKLGRILLLEVENTIEVLDDTVYVLINIYNENTEIDQIQILLDLNKNLDNAQDIQNRNKF